MRLTSNDISLKYIRERYKVPAYRLVEIIACDGTKGVIVGADGGYIEVHTDEKPKIRTYHPTDVKYLGVKVVQK